MNFPNLFIQENMGIWNSWAKIHHWGVHRAGQGCARKAPHWWVGGDREQMVSGNVSGVNNADILGCVSSARWSCVHAVDTNTKCLVHLKSLSLPYMGETQSPSPCWKHHQTDCQCTAVADILLWWRAAILALHLHLATLRLCSDFCVYAWCASLAAFSSMQPGVDVGKTDAFLLWKLSGKLVSVSPPLPDLPPTPRFCANV